MPRYIDADKLRYVMERYDDYAVDIVDDAPTADVVEIVRCRDCKWWDEKTCSSTLTPDNRLCLANRCYWRADDFCSKGERREDE